MIRGLLGALWLTAAGGCVALNAGFEDTDGTEGAGSSDTGQRPASDGDSDPSAGGGGGSAVTTVTAGESSGGATTGDPTHSGGSSGDSGHSTGSSGGDWTGGTSVGESSESGGAVCKPASAVVTEDAFLQTCAGGECAFRNFGQTVLGPLGEGEESSFLLLRLPIKSLTASDIEITVHLFAESDLDGSGLTLTAFPISSPCEWSEGPYDGQALEFGEHGATYLDCDGDPAEPAPWSLAKGGTVWDNVDPMWDPGSFSFGDDEVVAGTVFTATISLVRDVPAETPDALVIEADVPFLGDLWVYSSEGGADAPFVDVFSECN